LPSGFSFPPSARTLAMYHTIEFTQKLVLDLQVSRNKPLERLSVRQGTRLQAQIKPYVKETDDGFVEMADLFFDDGTTATMVPFACFSFAE
jgi:hypothetical protein